MNKSVSDLVNAWNEVRMGRKCGVMVKYFWSQNQAAKLVTGKS